MFAVPVSDDALASPASFEFPWWKFEPKEGGDVMGSLHVAHLKCTMLFGTSYRCTNVWVFTLPSYEEQYLPRN